MKQRYTWGQFLIFSDKWKDGAVSITLAQLWLYPSWDYFSGITRKTDLAILYHRMIPPFNVVYALLVGTCILAFLLFLMLCIVRLLKSQYFFSLAHFLLVVALIFPVRGGLLLYWSSHSPKWITFLFSPVLLGLFPFYCLSAFLCSCLLVVWLRKSVICVDLVRAVLILLFPLAPLNFVYTVQYLNKARPPEPMETRNLSVEPGYIARHRVFWLIFDEFDYRWAFLNPSKSLNLIELERLRKTAFFAENAYPPAGDTLHSLPSYIMGKPVTKAVPSEDGKLMLGFDKEDKILRFGEGPNLFSKAKEAGFNTHLIGFYHAYCSVLGDALGGCYQCMPDHPRTVFENIMGHLRAPLNTIHSTSCYTPLKQRLFKLIGDRRIDLVFAHLPVPHLPGIYDRFKGRFAFHLQTPAEGYLNNLALTDITIGEVRKEMEAAGIWEQSSLLITSDHWQRNPKATDGKSDHRIPFLVKLPEQQKSVAYSTPMNTVLSHDLVLLLLQNKIRNPQQLKQWLDERRDQILG